MKTIGREFLRNIFIKSLAITIYSAGCFIPISVKAQCPPVITPQPAPGVIINGNIVRLCAGDSVILSSSPAAASGYLWYHNGTLIPDSIRSIFTAKVAGTYKAKAPGCSVFSNTISLTVNPLPTAYITSNPIPPICSGTPITFVLHTNAPEYYWLPPVPSALMTEDTIMLELSSPTTMKAVAVTNTTPQCSYFTTYWVRVDFPINGGVIASDQTICSGTVPEPFTNIEYPSGGNGTYTYKWVMSTSGPYGPWIFIAGANDSIYTHPTPLTQTTWFARFAESPPCLEVISNPVMVEVKPIPEILAYSDAEICSGNIFSYFPINSDPGGTTDYTSIVSSGTVSGNTPNGSGYINDILTIPEGITSPGVVTYTITPTGSAPTFCVGTPVDVDVTVYPLPQITNPPLEQTICAGEATTPINLTFNIAGSNANWTATTVPYGISLTPMSGSGTTIPAITIYSINIDPVDVVFTITPSGPNPLDCPGPSTTFTVTVDPSPTVTNSPLSQEICSGAATEPVTLLPNVPGTNFTWVATPNPSTLTGYEPSGTNIIPAQTIINPENEAGTVTYHIIPSGVLGSCAASPRDYIITVYPVPGITSSLTSEICSNNLFEYSITSDVLNSTFTWNRPAISGITPTTASGMSPVIYEILHNSTNSSINVSYILTAIGPAPLFCVSLPTELQLLVRPLPSVFAGNDTIIHHGTATQLNGHGTGESPLLPPQWNPTDKINGASNQWNVNTKNLYTDTEFTLSVEDDKGCQNSDNKWVYLTGTPLAVNPSAQNNPICEGSNTVLFADASGGSEIYTYSWSPTEYLDNPSNANPIASPPFSTSYTVTVNDGYNMASGTITLNVIPMPIAFDVNGGGAYCAGGTGVTIQLNGSSSGVNYTLVLQNSLGELDTLYETTQTGTGGILNWNNQTQAGIYTIIASASGCPAQNMNGQAEIIINPLPTPFTVTGGGSYAMGGIGVPVGLSGSEVNFRYYLINQTTGIEIGPVLGNGNAISFGNQIEAGVYVVRGVNPVTNCEGMMAGSALITVNPTPTIFYLTGGGEGCENMAGVEIGLSGSEIGINYYLYNGSLLDTILPGTNAALNFGPKLGGSYTCMGINPTNGASIPMLGVAVVVIHPLPTTFSVVPSGLQCPNIEIRLNGSESGVSYTLWHNGIMGPTMPGTGTLGFISFGHQTDPGIYKIEAVNNTTGCSSFMLGSVIIQIPPAIYNVIPSGILCANQEVMLSHSDVGIMYQLRLFDTINISSPLAGNGDTLNFGHQSIPGIYRVYAYDPISLCGAWMNNSAYLDSIPQIFSITPIGDTCGSIEIGLNGSQPNFTYYLYRDNIEPPIDSAIGNGSAISFGIYYTSGLYTIKALDENRFCYTEMYGSLQLFQTPYAYNLLPVGNLCVGVSLTLDGSELGTEYQLIKDDSIYINPPILGSGSSISFGIINTPGNYKVIARNLLTSCSSFMNGTAAIHALPTVYTLSPTGDHCSGTEITLNSSQIGVFYHLNISPPQPGFPLILEGTGDQLNFGVQNSEGTYTITAYGSFGCSNMMQGNTIIHSRPLAYNLIPQGNSCTPVSIGLDNSQLGIIYHLYNQSGELIPPLIVTGTGSPISFGLISDTGTYKVLAINPLTSCMRWMIGECIIQSAPIAYAGADASICENQTFSPEAIALNYSLITWSTLGDGTFDDPHILHPVYTLGYNDILLGNVKLILNVTNLSLCPGVIARDTLVLYIQKLPQLNAGNDTAICYDDPFLTKAEANYCSLTYWTTTGIGDFADPYALSTAYNYFYLNPLEIFTRTDQLILMANGEGSCMGNIMTDTFNLTIYGMPYADAGPNGGICVGESYPLNGSGTGYSSIMWSSIYNGVFSNPFILNPVYIASTSAVAAGTDTLVLTLHGAPDCLDNFSTDTMVLVIAPMATVNAGPDLVSCYNLPVSINATATNYSIVQWTTTGNGVFSDNTILNPVYYPGSLDSTAGCSHLTLTAWGLYGCSTITVQDQLMLCFNFTPQVSAGSDGEICENSTFLTSSASANYVSSIEWTTSGDGTFADPHSLITTYSPGINDKINGFASLILTGFGMNTCSIFSVSDSLYLDINPLPNVYAGSDTTICSNEVSILLHGNAQHYSNPQWTAIIPANGTFTSPNSLVTNYLLTPSDTTYNNIALSISVNGTDECSSELASDFLTVFIDPLPVAQAGSDAEICADETLLLDGEALHYTETQWLSLGDGTFSNSHILNPIYSPGVLDKSLGSVKLVLKIKGSGSCNNYFTSDTLTLLIHPLPTAFLSGNNSICQGDSIPISVQLTGTPPWTIIYTNGIGSFTISGISDSPHTWYVSPEVTSLYTLTGVSDLYCNGTSFTGSALITLLPTPTPFWVTVSNGGYYCQGGDGVEIGLDGSELGIIYKLFLGPLQIGPLKLGTGTPISFGNIIMPGTYHVEAMHPSSLCSRMMNNTVTVTIQPLPNINFTADTACPLTTTHFTLSGTNLANIAYCEWNFGDGTSAFYAGPANADHIYPATGIYLATLTATSINGCQKTISHLVKVYSSPVTLFSWSTPTCQNQTINFNNYSYTTLPDYIYTWIWDFGDGTPPVTIMWPNNPNINHSFASSGTFNVQLKVITNHGCMDSITNVVQVFSEPIANFTWSNNCQSLLTQFNDLSQTGYGSTAIEWSWDFGDPLSGAANHSNIQNPFHQYINAGTYQVTLIVMASNGCSSSITKTVQVFPKPLANFSTNPTCMDTLMQFNDLSIVGSAPIIQWNWLFGDGNSSTLQNPSHLYNTAGNYNVELLITDSLGCKDNTIKTVTVFPLPLAEFSYTEPNCAGSDVDFTDFSLTSAGYITTWEWNFGDTSTPVVIHFPNSPNVSHIYNETGSYEVTLTITNSLGCRASKVHTVIVDAKPLANFTFPINNCQTSLVQFTDASVTNGGATIVSWEWNFDDPASGSNNSSMFQNPVHIFASAGIYNVRLIINNVIGCADTSIQQINISSNPTADFIADSACLGSPTHFINTSIPNAGVITGYDWDFGDGSPHSNNENATHTYTSAGIFSVTLIVTTDLGCIASVTQTVVVYTPPLALFVASTQNCTGSEVSFDDLSTTSQGYIQQWIWNFGDGSVPDTIDFPNSPDITHIYDLAGIYNVKLTVITSTSCSSFIIQQVSVQNNPMANFSYIATCKGLPTQFTDETQLNGGGILISWYWDFGDPASGIYNNSTLQNPVHVFSSADTFLVSLIVTNINFCQDTIIKQVIISPAPLAMFSADSACLGSPTHFTDLSIPNASAIASWFWNFGDGSFSTLQNPVHTYTNWGSYIVSLSVTNANGCMHDTTMSIFVNPQPVPAFAFSGNCAGLFTSFSDLSTSPSGFINSWLWEFGDGSSDTVQNPTHLYSQGGTFLVTLSITNSYGCQQSISQSVSIFNPPTANFISYSTFCPVGQVTFQDLSQGNGSPITQRLWNFGNGFSSNAANPVYTYPSPDSCYLVTLIVNNAFGCSDTTSNIVCVKPGFSFTISSKPSCAGIPTPFSPVNLAQGDSLLFVQWDFGDPASGIFNHSNQYYTSHIYSNPGYYVVKLKAWNSDNCLDSAYYEITILPPPVADFTWETNVPHCDTTITFTNLTTSNGATIDSLVWNFGDNIIIQQSFPLPTSITHTFPSFGFYEVTLTAFVANGCSHSISKTVQVKCLSANFAFDTLGCQNKNIIFNDFSSPTMSITHWLWLFGDEKYEEYYSWKPFTSHIYTEAGTYQIKLIVDGIVNGKPVQDSSMKIIKIQTAPLAQFIAQNLCLGDTVYFTDQSYTLADTINQWKWWFGDGKTSIEQNPSHLYLYDSAFDVQLAVSTIFGCSDTSIQAIHLKPKPNIALYPDGGLFCGEIHPIQFRDTIGNYSNYIWVWGDGDTLITTTPSATHVYDEGNYQMMVIVRNSYQCQIIQQAEVEINPSPVAKASADKYEAPISQSQFIFYDESESTTIPIIQWKWYMNDTLLIGNSQVLPFNFIDPEQELPLINTGTYKITLWVMNTENCSDSTSFFVKLKDEFLFNVPTAFTPNNDNLNNTFKPFVNFIRQNNFSFRIFNRSGMMIFETHDPNAAWDGTYNGEVCPADVYVWIVEYEKGDGHREMKKGTIVLVR
ncbi:MAG TPA: PKD domain-containing protein [Bacteroidales bacterium]|nr:PKD domain-containing protein [Bacteroidales bacterium]